MILVFEKHDTLPLSLAKKIEKWLVSVAMILIFEKRDTMPLSLSKN